MKKLAVLLVASLIGCCSHPAIQDLETRTQQPQQEIRIIIEDETTRTDRILSEMYECIEKYIETKGIKQEEIEGYFNFPKTNNREEIWVVYIRGKALRYDVKGKKLIEKPSLEKYLKRPEYYKRNFLGPETNII